MFLCENQGCLLLAGFVKYLRMPTTQYKVVKKYTPYGWLLYSSFLILAWKSISNFINFFVEWIKYLTLAVDMKMWITGMRRHQVQKWLTLGQITSIHCMWPWVLLVKMQRPKTSTIAGTWVLFLMPLTSSQQPPVKFPLQKCAIIPYVPYLQIRLDTNRNFLKTC